MKLKLMEIFSSNVLSDNDLASQPSSVRSDNIWERFKDSPAMLMNQVADVAYEEMKRQAAEHKLAAETGKRLRFEAHGRPKKAKTVAYARKRPEYVDYAPDKFAHKPCCVKRCCALWNGREEQIASIRRLVSSKGSPKERREAIWDTRVLLGPGNDVPCCHAWLKCVFGIRSNDKLYGRRAQRTKENQKDHKRICVIAWFHDLLKAADKMPDSPNYIIPAPSKRGVWRWYLADGVLSPELYPKVSLSYFIKVWSEYFPTVKLRKYLRFTKCCKCVKWRTIRWSKESTQAQKDEAMDELKAHYDYIKLERGFARMKQNHAWTHPDEVISIAIDGCENLAHGIPHFPEVCFVVCVCVIATQSSCCL
jgi:hypothetical protein